MIVADFGSKAPMTGKHMKRKAPMKGNAPLKGKAPMKRGRKPKKKKCKNSGKAATLPGRLWNAWTLRVLNEGRLVVYGTDSDTYSLLAHQ